MLAIALLCLPLFWYGLGHTYLWQDEAQTALLGRSVLVHGMPMVGRGADSLSAVQGLDEGIGGLYFQVSWLQAYLAAASFSVFGESSWSARAPFALAGWLCVPLVAWALLKAEASRSAARIASLMTALNVPFIICSRQARYYALAASLTLMSTGGYAAILKRVKDRNPSVLVSVAFGLSASLLVLSLDLIAMGIMGSLAVHWLFVMRSDSRRWSAAFWVPWTAASLVLASWIAASLTAPSRREHAGLGAVVRRLRTGGFFYAGQLNAKVLPLPVFLTLAALRRSAANRFADTVVSGNRHAAALFLFVAVGGMGGAMLSPFRYFRYSVPIVPVVIGLAAIGLGSLWSIGRLGKVTCGIIIAGLLTTTAPLAWSHGALSSAARASGVVTVRDRAVTVRIPLASLLHEFRDPPRGPVAAAVEYLRLHAKPGAVVVATYGELPLKFHTPLRVYGGETAQAPPDNVKPDWIWPRNLVEYREVRIAMAWVRQTLERGGYNPIVLPAIDRRWENREDPEEHIFSNPGPSGPPVVLYRAEE